MPVLAQLPKPDVVPPQEGRDIVLTKACLRASDLLGLSGGELARILGVSEGSVSRMPRGDYLLKGKPYELAAHLVRIFRSLDAIVGSDPASLRGWMRGDNAHLSGVPAQMIQSVSGLIAVQDYLDAQRAPL